MSGNVSAEVRRRIRQDAGDRCGYCLSPQHLVMGRLEIEHIIPIAAGGTDDEANLWLACRLCNCFKSNQTRGTDAQSASEVDLFNPRKQSWFEHFQWSQDGAHIEGRTAIGRATIIALQLNNIVAVTVRSYWVHAGWHPPRGDRQER